MANLNSVKGFYVEKFIVISLKHGYNDVTGRSYRLSEFSIDDALRISNQLTTDVNGISTADIINKYRDKLGLSVFGTHAPLIGGMDTSGNGWNASRGLFVLVITQNTNSYGGRYYVLQGYTDYMDYVSLSNGDTLLDEKIIFYFNSLTKADFSYVDNNGVRERKFSNLKNFSLIANYFNHDRDLKVYAPNTLLSTIGQQKYIEENMPTASFGSSIETSDSFYKNNMYTYALRADQNTTDFYKNVLNSIGFSAKKAMVQDIGYSLDSMQNGNLGRADNLEIRSTEYLNTGDGTEAEFLMWLKDCKNRMLNNSYEYIYSDELSFSYKELTAIFPDLNSKKLILEGTSGKAEVQILKEQEQFMEDKNGLIAAVNDDDYYGEIDNRADILYRNMADFNSAITHIMSSYCLAKVTCYVRGTIHGGYPDFIVVPQRANTFLDETAIPSLLNGFVAKMQAELLPKLIYSLSEGFEISVDCSVYMDSRYGLKLLDSNKEYVFKYPTFADSLYSPIINTVEHSLELVRDIRQISDSVASRTIDSIDTGGLHVGSEDYDFNY